MPKPFYAKVQVQRGRIRSICIDERLEFSLVGVLAEISNLLAEDKISIFAISTYDTDYILLKKDKLLKAIETLEKVGIHKI